MRGYLIGLCLQKMQVIFKTITISNLTWVSSIWPNKSYKLNPLQNIKKHNKIQIKTLIVTQNISITLGLVGMHFPFFFNKST